MPKSRYSKSLLLASLVLLVASSSFAQTPTAPKKPAAGPPAPQSKHYPILLLALGNDPSWSLRIGQKGPERLDRPTYPPIPLEPAEVTREGTADSWTYRAKDIGTGAPLSVHLTRETCTDPTSGTKYNFRAVVDHAQLGTLNGCARVAAELFPKIVNPANQTDEDEDSNKKKPPVESITNFKPPIAVAFINPTRNVVLKRGTVPHVVASEGTQLALSHDGRRLLYTRQDQGSSRVMVLYDSAAGKSTNLLTSSVQQPSWSPDDTRIAFLKFQDQKWQIWTFPAATPESAVPFYINNVTALHGWVDARTILASDTENLYWIGEGSQPIQTLALKDLYGPSFQVTSSDTIRVNPANPDLLLVSADYQTPPVGAPKDSMNLAAGFFLYEVRTKRRVVLSPPEQWARAAEWSRDGIQIFYTRRLAANSASTFRIFWDGSGAGPRRYLDGTDLVIGQ